MQIKINEIGRSMVEMLGVLAVTGVLSVGGIMGYRFAMDKYRANETLNELQIRVADLSRQMLNGIIELSVDEMGDHTRMGYPIRARISPQYADYFEVFLDEVPSGVCRQLLKSQWTIPYSIFVGTTEYEIDASICNEAETVTLAYEFKDDLTEKKYIEEEERHETWRCYRDNDCKCATCEQGLCKTMCPENSGCAKSYDNPNSWMCCLKDSIVSGLCCTSIGENGECCDSNNKCCPKDKPLKDKDGNCYACDDETQVNIEGTVENCAICSNRVISGSKKYCVLKCGQKGTANANKPISDTDGKCHSCDEEKGFGVNGVKENCAKCPNRHLVNTGWGYYCSICGVKGYSAENKPLHDLGGTCQPCDSPNAVHMYPRESDCQSMCPKRTYVGLYCYPACPADKPLRGNDEKCHSCDYEIAVSLSGVSEKKCTELCPNRKVENDKCILASCPENKPLMDANGGCHACDEEKAVGVKGVKENCSKCPNRYLVNTAWGEQCSICGVKGYSAENKPLQNLSGDCQPCDSLNAVHMYPRESDCQSMCPERTYADLYCYPACPADKPLRGNDGECHGCDYEIAVSLSGVSEKKCTELCPNRKVENDKCILASCPENKPLMDANGGCHACDEEKAVGVKGVKENCSKCPNRYLVNTAWGEQCSICGVKGYSAENKPLQNLSGDCQPCDSPNEIDVYGHLSDCEAKCPNRKLNDRICNRDYCSENAPLEDKNRICHPCNEPLPIDVAGDETKCGACLNRSLDGQHCVLNSPIN